VTPDDSNPSGYCLCGCGQRTPLSNRTISARGIQKGKPVKFLRGHHMRPGARLALLSEEEQVRIAVETLRRLAPERLYM
jgi:hypothetical protein